MEVWCFDDICLLEHSTTDQTCLKIHAHCFASSKQPMRRAPCIACWKKTARSRASEHKWQKLLADGRSETWPQNSNRRHFPCSLPLGLYIILVVDGVAQLRAYTFATTLQSRNLKKIVVGNIIGSRKPPSTPSTRLVLLPGLQDPIIRYPVWP